MSYYDDGLPDEAFTDLERASGVPGIIRGSAGQRYRHTEQSTEVTEDDCIALIVRSLVMQDLGSLSFSVVYTREDDGVDHDFASLAGFTLDCVEQKNFYIDAHHRYRISVRTLMNALRKIGLPLFLKDRHRPWLAWDEASMSLETNLLYEGGYLKRCFFPTGLDKQVTVPADPERARVFKLLRTAYLSSDHGKKPILTHNRHLAEALAKRPVPFESPSMSARV